MKRRSLITILTVATFSLLFIWPAYGAEKVKFGDAVKVSPTGRLPYLAAVEKGFWNQSGLEVDWVAFGGGQAIMQAVAARALDMGWSTNSTIYRAVAAGVPALIVSDLLPINDFSLWVSTKSKFKDPRDIRGVRIAVGGRGGVEYLYGFIIAKALGQEKDVKFAFTGGIRETLAAIKAGVVDGTVLTPRQMWDLKLRGEVIEFIPASQFLPKPWLEHMIFAHKEVIRTKLEVIKSGIRAILQATNFILDNNNWSLETMKKEWGYSQATAEKVFEEGLRYSRDGKINPKAVENTRSVLIQFGVVAKEKIPPAEALVAPGLTP